MDNIATNLKKDSNLLYWQARWYEKHKDLSKLKSLFISNSDVKAIKTDSWFKIRSLLVWDLVSAGDYQTAYKIAADHDYNDATNYVDSEWLAGKIAYVYLKKTQLAQTHFKNILENSRYSVSLAKGAYWTGITFRDMKKKKETKAYFKLASRYVDTFYGQLALVQLNDHKQCIHKLTALPTITAADLQWFKNNDLIIVGHILAHMHKANAARKFIQSALDVADTDGKKYLIAKLGEHFDTHLLSTISGKEAARRGLLSLEHAYPVMKLGYNKVAVEPELVHAIIRQESEFDPNAVSYAGATGLMQLMYSTAKEVAKKISHNVTNKSLKNPDLNLKLGSQYLQELLVQYNGSYILAITAYNAGPRKINEWIAKHGDPRTFKSFDQIVIWIENIPFQETRSYVQNVLSNLQIYKNLVKRKSTSKIKMIYLDLAQDLHRSQF